MIKIQAGPTLSELMSRFYGKKEVKYLPASLLRALSKQPQNLFQSNNSSDEATTTLEHDVVSDYME